MQRITKCLIGVTFAGVTALAAIGPANALPLPFADGSIDFTASKGVFKVNNASGHISSATTSIHVPSLDVNAVDGNFAASLVGATVTFSGSAHAVPNGGTDVPVNFTISINGIMFEMTAGDSIFRRATDVATHTSGVLNEAYDGKLINGGGKFTAGSNVTLTASCDQNVNGTRAAPVNCSYSLTAFSIPEPASLAVLAASLLGFGLIRQRRPAV